MWKMERVINVPKVIFITVIMLLVNRSVKASNFRFQSVCYRDLHKLVIINT